MANSELSKLKILFMYDYFRTQVSGFENGEAVSVNDIIGYLEEKTGYTFERKSIYADISKLNEYISKTESLSGSDEWIYSDGRKYRKSQLEGEITIDEARLIFDAISTTNFVDTKICDKIVKLFPTCFTDNYSQKALYPHYQKIASKSILWLNNIRNGIESKEALKISYGYKLGSELTEVSDRIVSPMTLDWENNCYYLIAVDNEIAKDCEGDQELTGKLKRYRLDRISHVSVLPDEQYIGYKNETVKKQEIKRFMDKSLSAYSSDKTVHVELVLKGNSRKETLKAYNALTSRVHNSVTIQDDTKLDSGILKINVSAGDVPTLYTDLFELSTFDSVEIEINNDEVCRKYGEYLKKAASAAKLKSLD